MKILHTSKYFARPFVLPTLARWLCAHSSEHPKPNLEEEGFEHEIYVSQISVSSVTSKKSPNVCKSCPKMVSLEKLKILTPLQKLPKNIEYLGKLIWCQRLWRVAQRPINHPISSHCLWLTGLSKRGKIDWRDYQISFYVSSVEASADIAPFAFLGNWKTIIWKLWPPWADIETGEVIRQMYQTG